MKFRTILLTAACGLMLLCDCEDKPKYGDPMTVRIYGVMGRPDLDTDLKMGLYVDEPVRIKNMPVTVSANGTIVSDEEIRWGYDQSGSSRFFVYAPYNESYASQEVATIIVPADQSTQEKLNEGNLITAVSSGGPKTQAVTMRMEHALTAMMVSFDNRTGQKIKSLSVSGFMTVGSLDLLTGSLKATGGKKTISPLRSPFDSNTFCFIYLPQDVTPVFTVTLESDKVIDITFDNYCHEHPGQIIYMDVILLTESTPTENILSLSGVNISQWTTNGVPPLEPGLQYMSLSELKRVEPDKDDGFFSAYINKVTVTAVEHTDNGIEGVILEDDSCAIHVWAHPDVDLKVGSTIVGPIMGYMNKPSEDEYHISNFYTRYATIGKCDSLPYTVSNITYVTENINKTEYMRIRFNDVVLKERFNNDRAVFVHDSTEFNVICRDLDVNITEGVRGNLTGFPVRTGKDVVIMVYDDSQFMSFAKEPADNVFTGRNSYGFYDLSEADSVKYSFAVSDDELQISERRQGSNRSVQVTDPANGFLEYFMLYDFPDTPVVGHEYNVAFNVIGKTELSGSTFCVECVKVDNDTAWFVDRSGTKGLILTF